MHCDFLLHIKRSIYFTTISFLIRFIQFCQPSYIIFLNPWIPSQRYYFKLSDLFQLFFTISAFVDIIYLLCNHFCFIAIQLFGEFNCEGLKNPCMNFYLKYNFFSIFLRFYSSLFCIFRAISTTLTLFLSKVFNFSQKFFFFLGFFIYFPINIVTLIACLIFSFRFY